MLDRVDTLPKLVPPEDAAITTLYIGGLTPVISEDDIRDQFYGYGELQSVKKVMPLLNNRNNNTVFLHAVLPGPAILQLPSLSRFDACVSLLLAKLLLHADK